MTSLYHHFACNEPYGTTSRRPSPAEKDIFLLALRAGKDIIPFMDVASGDTCLSSYLEIKKQFP
jgi:hypothetical protein